MAIDLEQANFANWGIALGQIQEQVKGQPDVDRMLKLSKSIVERIDAVRIAHEEAQKEQKYLCLKPHGWKWVRNIVAGSMAVSYVSAFIAELTNWIYQDETNAPPPVIYTGAISIALMFATGGAHTLSKKSEKKQAAPLEAQQNELKEALSIQKFFALFNVLVEESKQRNADVGEQELQAKRCVQKLQKTPKNKISTNAKARWAAAIIKVLPEESELRKKLLAAEDKAIQLAIQDHEKDNEPQPIHKKRHHHHKQQDEEEIANQDGLEEGLHHHHHHKAKNSSPILNTLYAAQATLSDSFHLNNRHKKLSESEKKDLRYELQQLISELDSELGINTFATSTCKFDITGNVKVKNHEFH